VTYAPVLLPYEHQRAAAEKMRAGAALSPSTGDVFALLMGKRCVDGDTEYLSPTGWRRVGSYSGGTVAEFRLDGTAHFVEPLGYIKVSADQMWHFRSRNGKGAVDQVLSEHHRILLCSTERATFGKLVGKVPDGFRTCALSYTSHWRETSPHELNQMWKKDQHVPLSFILHTDTRLDLSDEEIRLMVAFHADGTFNTRDLSTITTRRSGYVRVKKLRKKQRMRRLLSEWGGKWDELPAEDDYSIFKFFPPHTSKTYGEAWWGASLAQRRIICDEVFHWDGRINHDRSGAGYYSSIHEKDADFIQFCFVSTGRRAIKRGLQSDKTFPVTVVGHGLFNNLANLPRPRAYFAHDGYMYSFAVPSTYLVLRRNGKVFVTGNTGKTKVLIDEFGERESNGELRDFLGVLPGGALYGEDAWETQFPQHMPPDLRERARYVVWRSGEGKAARDAAARLLAEADPRRPRVLLVGVEALSTVLATRELCREFLESSRRLHRGAEMVVGESTCVKGTSARTEQVVALGGLAAVRRIESGLVAPQSPLDLFWQFYFLDRRILGQSSWYGFRARYAVLRRVCVLPREVRQEMEARGQTPPTVTLVQGYRGEEELAARIAPYSYRRELRDCREAPLGVYQFLDVEFTPEQARVYRGLRDDATAELSGGQHVTALMKMTRLMRMHQVCLGFVRDDEGRLVDIPERRTAALVSLLGDYGGKAVVWCAYDAAVRRVVAALRRAFGPESVAAFWGGNAGTRLEEERRFKNERACRWQVATAASGGRGREWSVADLVVYHSNTENLEHRDQSEDRVEAFSKVDPVTRVDLRVPGTVEDKIIRNLRAKITMAAALQGDAYREWLV
jgi:hypothetical protein